MVRHVAVVVGFAVGVMVIVGGLAVAWNRIQPQFRLPGQTEVIIAAPSLAEINKQRVQKESDELQAILAGFAAKHPGKVSLVTTDLVTGATASVNADEQMIAASLYKVFVAYGIYKKIDTKELKITDAASGAGMTVGQCLDVMITVSNNECGYALGKMFGWAKLDAELARLGYSKTKVNNYSSPGVIVGDKLTSARDVANFFDALHKGKLLSAESTNAFIALLKADELNTWLPSGLPQGAVIGHKTGALYNLVHDAGIVYPTNGEYLVVVMTKDWQNASTQPPAAFADISHQLWDYFTS